MNKSSNPILFCEQIEYGQNRQYNHTKKSWTTLPCALLFVLFLLVVLGTMLPSAVGVPTLSIAYHEGLSNMKDTTLGDMVANMQDDDSDDQGGNTGYKNLF